MPRRLPSAWASRSASSRGTGRTTSWRRDRPVSGLTDKQYLALHVLCCADAMIGTDTRRQREGDYVGARMLLKHLDVATAASSLAVAIPVSDDRLEEHAVGFGPRPGQRVG